MHSLEVPVIDIAARVLAAPLTARRGLSSVPHAVVILGAKTSAGQRPSRVLEERIVAGVELYCRGSADLVCITGTPSESEVMVGRARELGVPDSAIVIDSAAKNTYDNAANIAVMLRELGRQTVWVATQPFHSRRACFWFRHFGMRPLSVDLGGSLQYREPRKALAWIAREYVSWGVLAGRFMLEVPRE